MSFTTDESAADKITIKMSDQGGVAIESTKDIVLNAANTLSLSADKGIIMEAGKDLGAGAAAAEEPQFCALTGEGNSTSIILQEKYIHLHGTQKVTFDGAQKALLQPLEQPKEESYKPTTSDWWHMGLAIVGCLPVIGTVANVVDAGLYAAEGHYADAALSLAAAIPGAGEAAALAKVARLGKIISVGAKMAKVAKALHYVGTAARLIIGAKFIYQIANNKDKVVGMLKRMLNGKFDWSDPRFWTFAACITLALLRGRMTKALDKKLGIGVTREPCNIKTRKIDTIKDENIITDVKNIRENLPSRYKSSGNLATAEVNIEGINQNKFFAHSSIDEMKDNLIGKVDNISLQPQKPIFEAIEATNKNGQSYLRESCTEYKILNDIGSRLKENVDASGKIKLFTELEPCDSCKNVINNFRNVHKNIEIEVIHNGGIRVIPKNGY